MQIVRIILLTILFTFSVFQLNYAQKAASAINSDYTFYSDTTKKIQSTKDDSLVIQLKALPEGFINKYKNDPDFNYDGTPEPADDWITKISNWINQQLILMSNSKTLSIILDYLYYGLMIIALLLIIRGLIKADRRGLLFGKVNTNQIKMNEDDEDISQMNFDELISAAIASKQFKLAIRYMYLKSLNLLSEKGLIELKNNKTNYQYLSEIRNEQIATAFRNTTSLFEWIWYGDFPVDEQIVNSSQKDFKKLYSVIAA